MSSRMGEYYANKKAESVMSEKGHIWKTILFQGPLWAAEDVVADCGAFYLRMRFYVQVVSQSIFRMYQCVR